MHPPRLVPNPKSVACALLVFAIFGIVNGYGQKKRRSCSDFEMRQTSDVKNTSGLYDLRKFIWTNWQRRRPACANFAIYGKDDNDPLRSNFAITIDELGVKKLMVIYFAHLNQPESVWEVFSIRHDPRNTAYLLEFFDKDGKMLSSF